MSVNLNAFPFDSQITGYGADGLPEYDRASNSEEFASLIHGFWRDGVFGTSALTVLAGSGLTVTVGTGSVLIQGRVARITEAKTLVFDPADSQQRFDRVVARCDLSNAVRDIVLDVVKGTPASSPVAPALTRNQSKWELCLATVKIPAGATSVRQANITDTRLDSALCGLVAATMTEVDTSRFYNQVQGDLDDFRANEKKEINDFFDNSRQEFDSWLDELQGALEENAAANIMSQLMQKAAAYSEIVVLYSDGWVESEDDFYQEVACGIASGKISDSYVVSPTPSSIEAYTECSVYASAFGDGSVTFRAKSSCKKDVSVNILEIERGIQDGDVPELQEQVLKNAADIGDVKKGVSQLSDEISALGLTVQDGMLCMTYKE